MAILIVVNNPANWPLKSPGVDIVSAKSYLSDQRMSELRGAQGLQPLPVIPLPVDGLLRFTPRRGSRPQAPPFHHHHQDLKSLSMMRLASEDLDDTIRKR